VNQQGKVFVVHIIARRERSNKEFGRRRIGRDATGSSEEDSRSGRKTSK
jgi:hypothetical protein